MPEKTKHNLGTLWCAFMHDSSMWPIHGRYQCRTCGRHFPVPWAGRARLIAAEPRVRQKRVPSFRSALLPLVIMLALPLTSTVRAADAPIVESTAPRQHGLGALHCRPGTGEPLEF
jgi:hypothetical protein